MSKVLQVFYGQDNLPYKDKERQVHFPIVGNSFQGASNTTEIRFYYEQIITSEVGATWVAIAKLPNGKIGSKVLGNGIYDSELQEHYVKLDLSSFYTQAIGDLYISLQGYRDGVQVQYNSETQIYDIVGTPVIEATGSIKLAINYSTQPIGSDEFEEITIQELLSAIASKLDKNSHLYIKVVDQIANINTNTYKDYVSSGDIVYAQNTYTTYLISGTYPSLTYNELPFKPSNIEVGTIKVGTSLEVSDFSKIEMVGTANYTLPEYIKLLTQDNIPQESNINETFGNLLTKYGQDKIFIVQDNNDFYLVSLKTFALNQYVYAYVFSNKGYWTLSGASDSTLLSNNNTISSIHLVDSYVEITSLLQTTYTLSSVEKLIVANDNSYIKYRATSGNQYDFYHKIGQDTTYWYFHKEFKASSSVGIITNESLGLKVEKSSGIVTLNKSVSSTYTKDQIDTLFNSALVYKGTKSVAQVNGSAQSGNIDYASIKIGDFYNISDSGTITYGDTTLQVFAGDNICWTGTGWDKITMDLSAYDDKFLSAGFFEVGEYDEENGTITWVWASGLYSLDYGTYDSDIGAYVSDTGILTIEAN